MIAIRRRVVLAVCCVLAAAALTWAGDKALTFEELMKFRQIRGAVISADGAWSAWALVPDRGDGEVVIRSTSGPTEYRVERGSGPAFSGDGRWVVSVIEPTLEEREKARRKKGKDADKPGKGLSVVDLGDGAEERIDEVEAFALSDGGAWFAYRLSEEDRKAEVDDQPGKEKPAQEEAAGDDKKDKAEEKLGTTLHLRNLSGGDSITVERVTDFAFSESGAFFAYAVSAPEGEGNGIFLRDLSNGAVTTLHETASGHYAHLVWAQDADNLAFTAAVLDEDGEPGDAEIRAWTGGGEARSIASGEQAPEGYSVPSKNELRWSRDGSRLFFGLKPVVEDDDAEEDTEADDEETPFEPYDLDALLDEREVDVWHWNDPLIIPNQKELWKEEKDRVYRAVVHLDDGAVVPLADLDLPQVFTADNPKTALGLSDVPYRREITWDGRFFDLYAVNLRSGERSLVAKRLAGRRGNVGGLSPDGRHVLYYSEGDWHLFDIDKAVRSNLTAELGVPFADEDHDYPSKPPGYGHSEWLADSSGVLIYDKFDIWRIFSDGRPAACITGGAGRDTTTVFRVIDLDEESDTLAPASPLLVEAYHDLEKHDAFYSLELDGAGMTKLAGDGRHRLSVVAKAENEDRVLFTRERYDEFPDLWVSGAGFRSPVRISDANPQIADYAWGSAELVEWSSVDGTPLQGVLIKPGNYEAGKRYPVLVYYYRFSSQRLNFFNEPVVNHRPSFPVYASNGYAVFLPDIRFEVGTPGFSATKCLVPGVQKLVDMGVADPSAIGLHGHSWSGYQTAFVITQTDIFAAAVAGAPVSNMTSAYSGIRWGTGLARQFQYEKSQSRIGGSLWEYPERYIENSPVFFADRIDTPLLIQFGDEDGAVPWYQGIELYLACRRLDKNCIMLQYRGEPHHLKKYPNKLDYSIKMKQFFDHWLKGEDAPAWMTDGVPYRGE